jgi:hypothetical protein
VKLRGLVVGLVAAGVLALPSGAHAGGSTTISRCTDSSCEQLGSLEVGAYVAPSLAGEVLYIACDRVPSLDPSVRVCEAHNSAGGGNYVEPIGTSLPGAHSWVYVHHAYFVHQFKAAAELNGDSVEVVSRCDDTSTGTCLDP